MCSIHSDRRGSVGDTCDTGDVVGNLLCECVEVDCVGLFIIGYERSKTAQIRSLQRPHSCYKKLFGICSVYHIRHQSYPPPRNPRVMFGIGEKVAKRALPVNIGDIHRLCIDNQIGYRIQVAQLNRLDRHALTRNPPIKNGLEQKIALARCAQQRDAYTVSVRVHSSDGSTQSLEHFFHSKSVPNTQNNDGNLAIL